jgi:hypothetical protein
VNLACKVDLVVLTVRPIGLRADPMVAILPPVDRVRNAGQAVREAQAVRLDVLNASDPPG